MYDEEGYFDVKGDPVKLVHMPACAALFLRGDDLHTETKGSKALVMAD